MPALGYMGFLLLALCLEMLKSIKKAQNIHKIMQLIANIKISSENYQNFHRNYLLNNRRL